MRQTARRIILSALAIFSIFAVCSCRVENEPKILVERIVFNERQRSVLIGEEVAVGLKVEPSESRHNETLKFNISNQDIIELSSESNDGLIIKGLNPGNTVIVASSH